MPVKPTKQVQPDPRTQTIARTFSYSTTAFFLGAMLFLFTSSFLPLTERPDITGTIFLIGYALVYGNLNFFISRRYCSKIYFIEWYPYVLGGILLLPLVVLVRLSGDVFASARGELVLYFLILAGLILGAHYGIKKGETRRQARKADR